MKNKKLALLWSASLILGLTAGLMLSSCVQAPIDARSILAQIEAMGQTNRVSSETIEYVDVEMMYEALSFEDMTDRASAIFVGKIVSISPTQWNQDSGEYWNNPEEGFEIPIHYIEVDVLKPIVDTVKLGTHVKIAVLSESPTIESPHISVISQIKKPCVEGARLFVASLYGFRRQAPLCWLP